MTAKFAQDFITFAGDDVVPIFTVLDSSNVPVDISTVSQIIWYFQENVEGGVLGTLTKTAGDITFVTDGTDGRFQVAIPKTMTTGRSGWYQHVASITDALGNITTVTVGAMQVGLKPTWTYNPASIATVPMYQVRRYLGDVIANDQQMPDSEILFALSVRGTAIAAAAECARQLAAQYSRKVDTVSPGSISTNHGAQAEKYLLLADELESRSRASGVGGMPYAGGISITDKVNVQQDTDRVQPNFTIGMTDNTIPLKQLGPETPTLPGPNSGA